MKLDQRPIEDPPPSPFVPSEDWIDAFDAQCTESMIKRTLGFAERRFRGHSNDDYYAHELVQDALTDTVLGVLHWDPAAKSFELHIRDAIRLRARRDRERARRFPHESIDEFTQDGESRMMAEADAALLDRAPNASGDTAVLDAERLAELRQLATDDHDVLGLLDAFAGGETSKVDVMRVAGLSGVAYHNARRRLARLVTQLSTHVQWSQDVLAEGE